MRKANKALILGCSVLFTLGLLNFAGCSGSPESDPNNGGNGSAKTVDCGVTETDLGTEWKSSVSIPAEKFTDMVSGDYITITTEASESSATYYQLQLYSGSENYLHEGEWVNTGDYNTQYNVITLNATDQNTIYTPTKSEITLLKTNGLTIGGYGVKITKVTIRVNAYLDDSDVRIASDLNDSKATTNAKKVYAYLKNIYGEKMLTGVMDCTWSEITNGVAKIDMEAKVYNDTGKYPALVGYDFIELTKSDSQTWYTPNQVEEAKAAWKKGSLVTFCWHWLDPSASTNKLSSNPDTFASYEPDEIAFRIPYDESTGKLNESSANFTYIKNDLDTVASYLLQLQEDGVVVIWRPLHEAKGNCGLYNNTGTAWFWWGAGNSCEANGTKVKNEGQSNETTITTYSVSTDEDLCAASYKALWKYMYTYFTETKGLHNLIWLWNGQGAKWYPGDDYCDLVGYDIYDSTNANGAGQSYYNNLMSWCNSSKMAAISECGYIPSTTSVQSSTAKWLYYMVWNDDDALADDTSDDNDNFWGGTAYNSTEDKTTNSYDTDFTVKRGDTDLNALFTSMGVSLTN